MQPVRAVERQFVQSSDSLYQRWGKRTLDILLSLCGLVLLCPVLLACAIAVRLDSAGPVLFRQRRVGLQGRPLKMLKFRTMYHKRVQQGPSITTSHDPRITRVGRYLRKWKLDELPQLLNVLAGDMSVVGPRPEVEEYVALYSEEQSQVLMMKPGLTGAATLAFCDEEAELAMQSSPLDYYVRVLMPRKLALDLSYGENVSLETDVKIIFETARRTLLTAFGGRRREME
jgi:lipopolysaccharide/colanic/teichoic acid biosynthesis glycosyltransferase